MDGQHNWIWNYISEYDKDIKCNTCGKIYRLKHILSMKVHLFRVHEIYDEEDNSRWKNDTNDAIWQYFSKLDGYAAQCNVDDCQKLFEFAFRRYNLKNHLESFHKDIVKKDREAIAHTWLSPHFTLTDSIATCKHCNDSINIFRGINILRYHLDDYHNINEYSRRKERTGVYNSYGITQQSVDEGNSVSHDNILRKSLGNQGQQSLMLQQSVNIESYAGPSFVHNNTSRQSLGSQEDQQCLMLQQFVDTENYAVLSFDHNNTFRQSLGNQEG